MVSWVCRYMMPGSRMTERSSLGQSSAASTWFISLTMRSAFSLKSCLVDAFPSRGVSPRRPGRNLRSCMTPCASRPVTCMVGKDFGDGLFDLAAFRIDENDLLAHEDHVADALEDAWLVQAFRPFP